MDSKRLTAEALRGIKAAAEGNTTDTPMAFRSMLRSLLSDRSALEKRVGELEAALRPFALAIVNLRPESNMWNVWEIRGDLVVACRAAAKALADGEGGD